jgi:gamma-glutamyltranspeptidase
MQGSRGRGPAPRVTTGDRRPLDRRGFLKLAGLGGLAVGTPGLLAACGVPAATQTAESCPSTD